MKAAVLKKLGEAPVYEEFPDPVIANDQQEIITIKSASVKNLDKARAAGTHYSGYKQLPAVAGIDGVGLLADGTPVYAQGVSGTLAEKAVINKGQYIKLPEGIDADTAAALPNAVIGSAMALQFRAKIKQGSTVLVNGATGVTGIIAVQLAKYYGAGTVIATGRNARQLEKAKELGADHIISLLQEDAEVITQIKSIHQQTHIDYVIDYLWGRPAAMLLEALQGAGVNYVSDKVTIVTVGAMAGDLLPLSSGTLRSSDIEILGSGFGSLSSRQFQQFNTSLLPEAFQLVAEKKLHLEVDVVPLEDIQNAWNKPVSPGKRLVVKVS
ncbi:alcohol dehydrogenase [Niabella ginsenosidivorans]|uniref:Alcohol dehydrogenase n=1 Tax=Niabella ginsenosidivorans TaxID=1176587 RepID=A0A1A9I5E3_9BACT|nr:zinc-binding alcohol dehydrogenase family protein [Niabella ginsenosidivorans]ANH82783.1 alcohol dehydrogenase [Niabella ginsenosidivorans]